MHLDRLLLTDLRRHKGISVELAPLTILLGPNNVGKSSILDALGLLAMTSRHVPYRFSAHPKLTFESMSRFGGTGSVQLGFRAENRGTQYVYDVEFAAQKVGSQEFMDVQAERLEIDRDVVFERNETPAPRGSLANQIGPFVGQSTLFGAIQAARSQVRVDQNAYDLFQFVGNVGQYRMVPHVIAESGDATPSPTLAPSVNRVGHGITSLLTYMAQHDTLAWETFNHRLTRALDGYESIEFGPGEDPQAEQFMLNFSHASAPIPAPQLSDGTLNLIGLIAVLSSPRQWRVLCLEEPEIGLTPGSIKHLVTAIREGAPSKTPQPQVIASTHSPFFVSAVLDQFINRNDDVSILVVQRDLNTDRTSARPLSDVAEEQGHDLTRELGPEHIARIMDQLFG